MERICKRTIAFFLLLMLGMLVAVLSVFTVASGTTLAQTADQQRSYRLEVTQTRGTIYDCKMRSFTGQQTEYAAAIVPTIEDAAALSRILTQQEMADIYPSLTAGKPFALRVKDSCTAEGADVFPVEKRYADEQSAVHVIGYLDGAGVGVSGIEKLFDQQLSQGQGEISVTYQVDATNRVLAGEEKTINDTSFLSRRGVVLTLDQEIQTIAEQAAKKHLKKGAVVVTEIPTCKIRAIVSLPDFNPNDVASVLEGEDAPLLNRALSAYSVGSVFKLVSAASALEYGIPPETRYTCTGGIQVSDGIFHCYNGESHGEEDMSRAIAQSCNTYFVHVMQQVPQAQFLLMAQNLGFGSRVEIAPGFSSAAGDLPTLDSLNIPKALANFSFGQGDLTATPVQIAGMVNAIASGGEYTAPTIYEGFVNENLQYLDRAKTPATRRVMTEHTASLLRSFMEESVKEGTSEKFAPASGGAGAKTAPAQTGKYEDGVEKVISWVAGYYPQEEPRYVITVMGEDGTGGGATCGPVFKEIADALPLE